MNVSLYASNGNISQAEKNVWANDWRQNACAQSDYMPDFVHHIILWCLIH